MLSSRTSPIVHHVSIPELTRDDIDTLGLVAEKGLVLRHQLQDWRDVAAKWSLHSALSPSNEGVPTIDTRMQLGLILSHAISLCLSNLYRHEHYVFLDLETPVLGEAARLAHAREILSLVSTALRETNIAAIMFCWPLQVAALRLSMDANARRQSMAMLEDIEKRGYKVSIHYRKVIQREWQKGEFVDQMVEVQL